MKGFPVILLVTGNEGIPSRSVGYGQWRDSQLFCWLRASGYELSSFLHVFDVLSLTISDKFTDDDDDDDDLLNGSEPWNRQ